MQGLQKSLNRVYSQKVHYFLEIKKYRTVQYCTCIFIGIHPEVGFDRAETRRAPPWQLRRNLLPLVLLQRLVRLLVEAPACIKVGRISLASLSKYDDMVQVSASVVRWAAATIAFVILGSPCLEVMAFSSRHHNTRLGARVAMRGKHYNNIRGPTGRLWSNLSGGNDDDNEDPNPGGMNDWSSGEDERNKRSFQDLNLIEQVQEWFASPEGKEDVQTYAVSLGIALLLRLIIIEPRYIPSLSMFPTFEVGDQLAVEKVTKRIRPFSRKEVVVFNPPEAFREYVGDSSRKAKEALIKRVIAIEVTYFCLIFVLMQFD